MTSEPLNPSTELPVPPIEPQNTAGIPQAPMGDTKLALDEFNDAIGDGELPRPTAGSEGLSQSSASLEALYDIPVNITVVLGRTNIEVSNLLALNKGDIVELDRKVGEPVDILVNNRLVARGEVVLVDDLLGITMTEIIKGGQAA